MDYNNIILAILLNFNLNMPLEHSLSEVEHIHSKDKMFECSENQDILFNDVKNIRISFNHLFKILYYLQSYLNRKYVQYKNTLPTQCGKFPFKTRE